MSGLFESFFRAVHKQVDPEPLAPTVRLHKPFSTEVLRSLIDRNDPNCVFYGMVGQDNAIEQLLDLLLTGLQSPKRCIDSVGLLFTGPPSTGKTECARRLGRGLENPYVETDVNILATPDDAVTLIESALKKHNQSLTKLGMRNGLPSYMSPPLTFFIDEFHAMKKPFFDAMLKAFESRDRMLTTRKLVLNCKNVLWIGATTQWDRIPRDIDSRFYSIPFLNYTLREVAEIVKLYQPSWGDDTCLSVARYGGSTPRQAKAFADAVLRKLRRLKLHDKDCIATAITLVGNQSGIRSDGITHQQIAILKRLQKQAPHGCTYADLEIAAAVNVGHLKRHVLPSLQIRNEERREMIIFQRNRWFITEHGSRYLASIKESCDA